MCKNRLEIRIQYCPFSKGQRTNCEGSKHYRPPCRDIIENKLRSFSKDQRTFRNKNEKAITRLCFQNIEEDIFPRKQCFPRENDGPGSGKGKLSFTNTGKHETQ